MNPIATYRLQFREGTTFDTAAATAPYLARLGISHLYASPVCTAIAGSTHGYDVCDHQALDPALGGADGFDRLSQALRAEGLGLILDIVPNHMAASPENPWWRDVLEWGEASRYADHFDIDWSAASVSLPILGAPYGEALAAGEFQLAWRADWGRLALSYHDHAFPLDPRTLGPLLERLGPPVAGAAAAFAAAGPCGDGAVWQPVAGWAATGEAAARLADAAADTELIHALHEAQSYRLMHWRAGRDSLTYRRFFEITGLVGVRVELAHVFDDVHRLPLRLIAEGRLDGLRVDHVDGLADPKGYLERLRAAVAATGREVPIYVEKILEPPEQLRADWPVAGTTGYEFIAALAGLLTSEAAGGALDEAYAGFLGETPDYAAEIARAKSLILSNNLAGELDTLIAQAQAIAAEDLTARDFGADTLRQSIAALMSALHVYRTYVDADGPSDEDRALLADAEAEANAKILPEEPAAVAFIVRLLCLDVPEEQRPAALAFAVRFQQTSGPLMAKALEDTLFYRYNRLIALNEVGGDPSRPPGGVAAFHAAMAERLATQPLGLTATATHDTKRGEDARARLTAISEAPAIWSAAVAHWAQLLGPLRREIDSGPAPGPALEWALYQALLGVWPLDLAADDGAGLEALAARFLPFVEKAMREAKLRTSWTAPDEAYEAAVLGFAACLFDGDREAFRRVFLATAEPFFVAGALNGLAQTLLKVAVPGVPDIYQGTERWDFALVDPDNRRPVDFAALDAAATALAADAPGAVAPTANAGSAAAPPTRETTAALLAEWRDGRLKQFVLMQALALRRDRGSLFEAGDYVPLEADGTAAGHVVAFLRRRAEDAVLAVAPRLPLDLLGGTAIPMITPARWADTSLPLPPDLAGRTWRNAFTGADIPADGEPLKVANLLAEFPVLLASVAGH